MTLTIYANVAQLFRALPCQGRGRELESLHSHHIGFVAQLVRAPPCHGGGREFESRRIRQTKFVVSVRPKGQTDSPDKIKKRTLCGFLIRICLEPLAGVEPVIAPWDATQVPKLDG